MNKKALSFFTGIILILSFPVTAQQKSSAGPTEIIILHVNDMHSKIDNISKLAYLADSLRKLHPNVFLVSAGDNFTGNPVVDMVTDKGYPMIDLMNRCGFDVSTIGNHEFDMGQELFNRRREQAAFPFISCNIEVTGGILKQPKPFITLKAGEDLNIVFLGAIELNDWGIPDTHPSNVAGLKFSEPIKKMKEFAGLRDDHTLLIGLTHLGVETDVILADSMPQLDLIIGGHSHTLIKELLFRKKVEIVQAGSNLKYVGKTTLIVDNKGKLIERWDEIIPMSALTGVDPQIRALIDKYNHNEAFSKVVGVAETPLEGYDELGSLMTDAMRERLKVDFAFQNQGGIRVQSIPRGNITMKDVYQLDPFNNQIVVYRMNQEEITSLIRNAFNMEKSIDLQVSGLSYTVTTDREGKCAGVKMIDNLGKPLNPSREYSVAVNSYMAASYRFNHRDPGITQSPTTVQVLIDYLSEVKKVNYSGVKRTFLSTESD